MKYLPKWSWPEQKNAGTSFSNTAGPTAVTIWYDPKDRQGLVKTLQKEGYVEKLEARFRRKNGQIGVGLMSARVLRLHAQHAIGEQAGDLEVAVQNTEVDLSRKNDILELEIGSYVRISVKDTGYGMAPDLMKRILSAESRYRCSDQGGAAHTGNGRIRANPVCG